MSGQSTCDKDDVERMETDDTAPTSDGPASDHLYRHFLRVAGQDELEEKLEAFRHNCELQVKEGAPQFSGCHDLDCFLQAVASGVVVASIDKLPGDGLPNGVYQFQMSCRKDLPTPNQTFPFLERCPRHDISSENCRVKHVRLAGLNTKDKACAGTIDFRYSPYTKRNERKPTYVECPIPMKQQSEDKTQLGEIKFKLKPQVKTVYNPAIWTKKELAEKCSQAFEHALNGEYGGKLYAKKKRWSGPFFDDNGDKYWIEGFYKTIQEKKLIYRFHFVHTDILKKNPEHKETVFPSK